MAEGGARAEDKEVGQQYKRRFIDGDGSAKRHQVFRMTEIDESEEGIFEGIVCRFNAFNQHNERFLPGCFTRAISERFTGQSPPKIKATYRHCGAFGLPILMEERDEGLWVRTQITDHRDTNKRWYIAVRDGVVDGLSIEFIPLKSLYRWLWPGEYEPEDLGNPDDWWWQPREFERCHMTGYGFVMFPSDDEARVEAFRSIGEHLRKVHSTGWRPEGDGQVLTRQAPAIETIPESSLDAELRSLADRIEARDNEQQRQYDALSALADRLES